MKRRQFLNLGLQSAVLLSTPSRSFAALADETLTATQKTTLAAFIDTLIPEDETPSATGLGLDKRLVIHAQSVHNYVGLLVLGCQWLDAQAQAQAPQMSFSRLSDAQRQSVVSVAEMSPPGSIAKQLFDHVSADLFNFYYSHPASWPSLGLHGAPQPLGYLDYIHAPKKTV